MITKGRDEKFGPEKPRNRGDREIGGREIGGMTVLAYKNDGTLQL